MCFTVLKHLTNSLYSLWWIVWFCFISRIHGTRSSPRKQPLKMGFWGWFEHALSFEQGEIGFEYLWYVLTSCLIPVVDCDEMPSVALRGPDDCYGSKDASIRNASLRSLALSSSHRESESFPWLLYTGLNQMYWYGSLYQLLKLLQLEVCLMIFLVARNLNPTIAYAP